MQLEASFLIFLTLGLIKQSNTLQFILTGLDHCVQHYFSLWWHRVTPCTSCVVIWGSW